jgi:Fe-S-cluster containining protein
MEEKNPCDGCDLCCRHVAVEIDEPETKKEFDQIRWFLLHEDVWIFIDNDNSWNMQVNRPCVKLKDGRCSYYENRPRICRDYSAESCEKHGDGDSFKIMWKSLEEFEEWVSEGKVIPED